MHFLQLLEARSLHGQGCIPFTGPWGESCLSSSSFWGLQMVLASWYNSISLTLALFISPSAYNLLLCVVSGLLLFPDKNIWHWLEILSEYPSWIDSRFLKICTRTLFNWGSIHRYQRNGSLVVMMKRMKRSHLIHTKNMAKPYPFSLQHESECELAEGKRKWNILVEKLKGPWRESNWGCEPCQK